MSDLVDFLNARLAEDEAEARERGTHAMIGHLWKHLPESDYNAIQADWLARSRRVLAECAAKRQLIEKLQAERHAVVEDCWYTCPAATEDVDGGECCNDAAGSECYCGRDTRVNGYLALLAVPFADHPDFPGGVR